MYTPPQNDERPSSPNTFSFSPVGIGKKEKREQWVWKGETNETNTPKPFSYEYVVEDGKLPTITICHPTNETSSLPLQRKLSKRTRPRGLERHSSPASTEHTISPPSPRSSTRATTKLRRVLSLTSLRVPRLSFEEDKKQLPPVPRIESTVLSDAMAPTFERTFLDASEAESQPPAPQPVNIPPRSSRRPSVIYPNNATPRIPNAPQITPTRFEGTEDNVSPIMLTKDYTLKAAPTQAPHPSSERLETPPKLSIDTRPVLQRRGSKFKEHIESPKVPTEHSPLRNPSATPKEPVPSATPVSRYPQPQIEAAVPQKAVRIDVTPKYAPTRQMSVSAKSPAPSIPKFAMPRRAATVRTPTSAQSGRAIWADVVCTAEAIPVWISPIVASGTARLVSC